jgi:hypothetical protein
MARLSKALMHASAAAGGVEEKRSASLEGFVETDAMPQPAVYPANESQSETVH